MKNIQLSFLKSNQYRKKYTVSCDGSHFIARLKYKVGGKTTAKKSKKPECRDIFDILYDEAIAEGLSGSDLKAYITKGFIDDYCYELDNLEDFIEKNIARKERNLWQREKRFRKKAYLNGWNYFVTFTYDGNKQTEESFKKKLRRCLSNLHNRRGWRYMGVSERGEESGRFHYHFLMSIPKGEMVGELYTRKDYSIKRGTVKETVSNTFFEKRFGRNDFEEVIMEVNGSQAVSYLLKYMRKTNCRAIYSRGIPSETDMYFDSDYDFACEITLDGVPDSYVYKRWVIYDSVMGERLRGLPPTSPLYRMNC